MFCLFQSQEPRERSWKGLHTSNQRTARRALWGHANLLLMVKFSGKVCWIVEDSPWELMSSFWKRKPVERAGGTLQSFERDVFLVKEELAIQKKESTKRHNELKQELQELKISLRASRSPVEFPACMEDLRQPMRLKQCGKGNL